MESPSCVCLNRKMWYLFTGIISNMKVEGNQLIWVRFNFSSSLYLPTSLGTFPGSCSKEQEPLSTTSTISFVRSGDKILIFLCSSLLQQIFYQWPVARSHCRPGNIPWSSLLLVAEEEMRGRSKCCVWCPRSPEKAIWQDHLSEKGSCSDKLDVTSVLASASLMAFCSSSAWLRGPGAAYWIQPGINHFQRMKWGKSKNREFRNGTSTARNFL